MDEIESLSLSPEPRAVRHEVEQLQSYLRDRNLPCTPQRVLVLRVALDAGDHFDVEQLCERLRRKGRVVSRATVYRTLPHLQQCGLIREVFRSEGRAKYERTTAHHDHMLCLRCGSVVEFAEQGIEQLQQKVCRRHGFKPVEHRLGIRGICKQCQMESITTETQRTQRTTEDD